LSVFIRYLVFRSIRPFPADDKDQTKQLKSSGKEKQTLRRQSDKMHEKNVVGDELLPKLKT
jgi:hypothetical protein